MDGEDEDKIYAILQQEQKSAIIFKEQKEKG